MKHFRNPRLLCIATALALCGAVARAQEGPPGADLPGLLTLARQGNPEYAGMRYEIQAAAERVEPAGALPDPKFRLELRDITRFGEQNPSLLPGRVGSTRYLLMQDLPWFGKRELRREIAEIEVEASRGRTSGAWSELAARIKIAHAQRYYLQRNEQLTREQLDLVTRLEQVAQTRYAGGLATQQDVIRSQVEQTNMRSELVALASERRQVDARLNTLLARPAAALLAEPLAGRVLPEPDRFEPAGLEQRVRAGNPLLLAEEARIRSAQKSRDLAYKNRYPDFTLGISPIQYQTSIKEWELMVEINIPFQQSSRRAQERESEAMLAVALSRKETLANQLLAELAQNLAGIEAAQRTGVLAGTSLAPQAELSFRSAVAGYENGKVDFATLLDAQRQIRQARQTRIKAEAEAQMRLAEIEKLLGEDL